MHLVPKPKSFKTTKKPLNLYERINRKINWLITVIVIHEMVQITVEVIKLWN